MVETSGHKSTGDTDLVTLHFSVSRRSLGTLISQFGQRLEETVPHAVSKELAAWKSAADRPVASVSNPKTATSGVALTDQERFKAAELRTALLLGKIPDEAGLLIDTKAAARLLNMSARTLYRLHQLEAIPAPVRIGGKIVRFRVAELLAWIEADCPPRKHWHYSPESPSSRKRR